MLGCKFCLIAHKAVRVSLLGPNVTLDWAGLLAASALARSLGLRIQRAWANVLGCGDKLGLRSGVQSNVLMLVCGFQGPGFRVWE